MAERHILFEIGVAVLGLSLIMGFVHTWWPYERPSGVIVTMAVTGVLIMLTGYYLEDDGDADTPMQ